MRGKRGAAVSAIQYAGLVGKYIRMERPATEVEQAMGNPPTVGMECTVASVYDVTHSSLSEGMVVICSDDGLAFEIKQDNPPWAFSIWPDEATAKQFRSR